MPEIPKAVLSERFAELMKGQRLRSAVFLTFRLDPGFFEQEILPAVIDLPLSHVPAVRLMQLEEHLRSEVDDVAVYYDRGGLAPESESAKLDVRRVPISISTGYFHPKNVFLLSEAAEADKEGRRPLRLLVASMSANLTQAGWWDNVEVCHIEMIEEGTLSSLRGDLLDLIRRIRTAARAEERHDALDAIHSFVRGLEQRQQRSTKAVLHPRLYCGGSSVPDFLDKATGGYLNDLCLEVISPYFDDNDPAPLCDLVERFQPREVRVLLPRKDDGSALCSEAIHEAIRAMKRVSWARLPAEMLSKGKAEAIARRRVHAKVYRFFDPKRCYEALFVGSVNLTRAAHSAKGNFETAFLVETNPSRIPDWWLIAEGKKAVVCAGAESEEETVSTTALSIRYEWGSGTMEAFWDKASTSPLLRIAAQGRPLFQLSKLPSRSWQRLSAEQALAIADVLPSTSFLSVTEGDAPPATILVQEEGMAHKPSILLTLSVAEILRYWALLTPEQRQAFLDKKGAAISEFMGGEGAIREKLGEVSESIFDTFAGIYQSFGSFSSALNHALEQDREKEAEYRLFGRKYDSLRNLLDRALDASESAKDPVDRYVTVLCARQIVQQVERDWPAFVTSHRKELRDLKALIERAERVKESFTFGTPEERAAFIDWYEDWFLTPAKPMEAT